MSAQSDRKRPSERAFVIQFEPVNGGRSRARGRVELVASGEALRFRSVKQLVAFMMDTLRKPPAVGPPTLADPSALEESR